MHCLVQTSGYEMAHSDIILIVLSLQEIQQVKTPEELENFMLKHGENIIDTLGAEVDRLEKELKVLKGELVFFGNTFHKYFTRRFIYNCLYFLCSNVTQMFAT